MTASLRADARFTTDLLTGLVRINSVNPAFGDGSTNERRIAEHVAGVLAALGLDAETYEAGPDRPSVVGRLRGTGSGRSLLLYAHLDTVGVEGMAEPFSGAVRDGKLYGRGAYDMKGGLAACIAAAKALVDAGARPAGDVLVVGVADEETASIGMQQVLRALRADGAVVTEPTELGICLAHKGFCWIEVETLGRAAHGSRFDLGVDANMRMGRFLGELAGLERRLRTSPGHPLLGPPSLHAGVLAGGSGASTYAERCRVQIERRTVPGETEAQVVGEIEEIVGRLATADDTFQARVRTLLARPPFETAADTAVVRAVARAAASVLGEPPRYVGQTPWMDAALLQQAGVDTVVIGPAGAGAHAAEEWVEVESVVRLAEILARTAVNYCEG